MLFRSESFMPEKGIFYYNSTTTTQPETYPANGTLFMQFALLDLRYSFNTGATLTIGKPIYLVVTPQSDGQVKLASTPIVQTLPTTQNSNYYIYLGQAHDSYRSSLVFFHPIFKWNKKTSSFTTDSVEASDSISSLNTSVTTLNSYFTNGIAKKATADASGNVITSTYVKKAGDTMSGGLSPATNKGASLGTSSLYWNNIYGTALYEDGTALTNKYAPKSHTHDKSEVGLGNVNNTADADKNVKYATTAGSANSVAWDNVSGKPSSFNPASHTHSYLPLSGGALTGPLNFYNNTWNLVGDDVYVGDYNQGGSLGIKGKNGQTNIGLVNQSNDYYIKLASPGVTANRTITMPDDTGTMALTKDVVPKKYNNKFYPFIGSASSKANYKVTLPISGRTSSNSEWMMITMELILGGSYDGGTNGTIFLSYYFLKDSSNHWTAGDVRAIGIGNRLADNSVSIQYDISNPGIFYVHANVSQYNSFSIQNLTANDTDIGRAS